MEPRVRVSLDRIRDAGVTLLLCGFRGLTIGGGATFSLAVLFVGPAALYVALWGALSGFCAAICGAALGGGAGWTVSGTFWGLYGGYNLVLYLSRIPTANGSDGSGLAAMLVVAGGGIGGFLIGDVAARNHQEQPVVAKSYCNPLGAEGISSLFSLYGPVRLALAVCQLLPVLACVPTTVAHVPPELSGFAK